MFRALLSPILLAAIFLQQPSASPSSPDRVASPGEPSQPNPDATHIGGSVTPPVLIHSVEPKFTRDERREKFQGNVRVYCWVEESGVPSHVRLVQGLRKDLDEKAVAAVSQYRFKPAMKDGKPVKVDLYIDVNIDIY